MSETRDPATATPDEATTVDPENAGERRSGFQVARKHAQPAGPRYQRGREIARGGIGRITSARDVQLHRDVAIKELHQYSENARRRFVREGVTTARLQHPAIVPVIEAGTWSSGDPYLVMKLLEGKTLAEELVTRTTLEQRLGLLPSLLAVADALGYAHEQGVVHRDVKPSNIMIGKHGESVLLDWGVASDRQLIAEEQAAADADAAPDPQLTAAGVIAGTVRYMSPEQARGEAALPSFDVFSLGATIAHVLAGDVPFSRYDATQTLERLRTGAVEIPALPADTPADLAAIVAKATAVPGQRYSNGGELAADLRKFIAGQLVSARRYTRRELVARWIRRHRLLIGVGGAAVAAIVVVSAIALRSVVHERNVAVHERTQAEMRERDLVLLQARASLHSDPTATLAWLARYPIDAPRQDEVLELADEAIGRGVARHVWHASTVAAGIAFDGRTVISAHRDGELAREDLATGARVQLANLGAALFATRATGTSIYVVDEQGAVQRWTPAGARRVATALPGRVTGLFLNGGDSVKVGYFDSFARVIGGPQPAPGSARYADDQNDGDATFQISAGHDLQLVASGAARTLWTGIPANAWVRGARDASTYAAVLPAASGGATLWVGSAGGAAPVKIADVAACPVGASQEMACDVAERDPRYVALQRCNVLHVFDVEHGRELPIDDPSHVQVFVMSHGARWLVIGRASGLELLELATGVSHALAAESILDAMFSNDDAWLVTTSHVQGLRAWDLRGLAASAGWIADGYAPTVLALAGDQILVRRHHECALYDPRERRLGTTFGADDNALLWPVDASADGRTCVLAGQGGVLIAVRADRSTRRLRTASPAEECVLSLDGATAYCSTTDGTLVTFATATGEIVATRHPGGSIRSTVRYHDVAYAIVARDGSCTLETYRGERVVALGGECRRAHASGLDRPGHETAIVVDRPGFEDVWTPGGVVTIPAARAVLAEVSESGLVAIWNDREIEVWDHGSRRAGPPLHPSPIQILTWSPSGLLAAVDDDSVRVWDPASGRTRVLAAPHVISMVWALDGRALYTSDGRVVREWRIDLTSGADPHAVRARIEQLTTAVVVGDRVQTP